MSIVWYKVLPAHFGGQKGIAHFNEALGELLPLVCVCSKNNETASAKSYRVFNWLPTSKLQIANPFIWWKLYRFAKRNDISHVILEHPYHAIAGWFLKLSGCKIILHSHNIEYRRFKDLGKRYWKVIEWLEAWACRNSDLVLFVTQQDLDFAVQHFNIRQSKCMVVPFGVDRKDLSNKVTVRERVLQQHKIPLSNKILLFNGTLDYTPNAKAVERLLKYIAPGLPASFTIIITGKNAAASSMDQLPKNIIIADYVDNVEDYFLAADVFINPVAEGGGIQTKTLEALSYGLNVVCWQNMLNGINQSLTGNKLYIAKQNNWADFLNKTIEAATINSLTPSEFFKFYSFRFHAQEVANRIENQNA